MPLGRTQLGRGNLQQATGRRHHGLHTDLRNATRLHFFRHGGRAGEIVFLVPPPVASFEALTMLEEPLARSAIAIPKTEPNSRR